MGNVKFSPETIEKLRSNKYVEKVTESSVRFSPEFKAIIISESRQGKTQKQILKELSIDSEVFGKERLESLFHRARQQAKRPEGFERTKSPGRPKKLTFSSAEEENRYLRDRNEYLEQENEFLKKLKALERGE
jgi:transposase-like protein